MAQVVPTTQARTNPPKLRNLKEIGGMKLPHRHAHFNELPLWAAARIRDLKRPNPATSKLRKRLGVSEQLADVLADLSGLGSKEARQ